MSATAYLLGRDRGSLAAPYKGTDLLYVAQRLDRVAIEQGQFEHCTLANISFKESRLSGIRFLNCVFIECYLRRTDIRDCSFAGCKFISCDFPRVAIKSCDFRYAQFDDCFIPYPEIEHSLPHEPNLREELARNLATAASDLGFYVEAREFSLCEIIAHEQHLKAATLAKSEWYRQHYDSLRRLAAAVEFGTSVFNRVVWGSGFRATILLRTFLVLTLGGFPLLFAALRDHLSKIDRSSLGAWDFVYFSMENMLPTGIKSGVTASTYLSRFAAGSEALIGLIITGLFASYLFARINER